MFNLWHKFYLIDVVETRHVVPNKLGSLSRNSFISADTEIFWQKYNCFGGKGTVSANCWFFGMVSFVVGYTLLNRTLPNQNLLYRNLLYRNLLNRTLLNRTLLNQNLLNQFQESAKPHSAKPESAKTHLGIC